MDVTRCRFAEFFRETLRSHGDLWTLDDELQYIRRYVALQSLRLGERLRAEYHVKPGVSRILVPVLALQALVENAIIHGIEPKVGGGLVVVSARRADGVVTLAVEDDGVGIPPDRLAQVIEPGYGTGLGIGLYQAAQWARQQGYRLALRSNRPGGEVCFELAPVPGGGA